MNLYAIERTADEWASIAQAWRAWVQHQTGVGLNPAATSDGAAVVDLLDTIGQLDGELPPDVIERPGTVVNPFDGYIAVQRAVENSVAAREAAMLAPEPASVVRAAPGGSVTNPTTSVGPLKRRRWWRRG